MFSHATRASVPRTVTPSHCVMGVSADQLSEPVPARVSRAASSVSQSDTSPVFVTSATAPPVTQTLAACVVAIAVADQGPSEETGW